MDPFDDNDPTDRPPQDSGLADRPLDEFPRDDRPLGKAAALDGSAAAGRRPRWPLVTVGVILALALIALAYFYLVRRQPEVPAEATATETVEPTPASQAPPPEPAPAINLPAVDASDPLLRELGGQLSANPQLAAWLGADALARRFVASVDNIADGTNPATHLGFLRPSEPFQVMDKDGLPHIDPKSYHRFDKVTEVFASLDSQRAASVYATLRPLLQAAYKDLGYPDGDFDETLRRAIDRLRSTSIPEGDVALTPRVVTYAFSDPDLESLSGAQRALLRMGPDNARRIQAKLGELERALGL